MIRSLTTVWLILAAATAIASDAETPSSSGKMIVFNVDGATNTAATSLNNNGDVAGYFTDNNHAQHGFIRHAGGEIETFDIPGAIGATPISINDFGETAGYVYLTEIGTDAGFFRDASGQTTTFWVSGAIYGTYPVSLNNTGQILGFNVVNGFGTYGFIRDRSGTITTVDAPHSGCNIGLAPTRHVSAPGDFVPCTYATRMNNDGEAVGYFGLNSYGNNLHGYKRTTLGDLIEFRIANSINTRPAAINDPGWVTGSYDAAGTHGFIGGPDGSVTTFDAPDATNGTWPTAMNVWGAITGYYWTADSIAHGFVRDRFGLFTEFDARGGTVYTFPAAINNAGQICGRARLRTYRDAAFIRE